MSDRPTPKRRPSQPPAHAGGEAVQPMMDIEEVAWRLGTSVRHIRRLVLENRIPYYKFSGKLRFERAEIEAWIAAAHVPAQPEFVPDALATPRRSTQGGLRPVPRRRRAS